MQQYAAEQPGLSAAVVYCGVSPAAAALGRIRAPVHGLYGGDDARVNATVGPAQEEMRRLGKRFEVATCENAWPRMVEFLVPVALASG